MKKKRVIKSNYGRFKILLALYKEDCLVDVYDTNDVEENADYRMIHNTLWDLKNNGLIVYERSTSIDNSHMQACITFNGINFVKDKFWLWVNTTCGIIAAITGVICVFKN